MDTGFTEGLKVKVAHFLVLDLGSYGSFPKSEDPNIDPKHIIVLIMGTPKKVPLILGNYHMGLMGTMKPAGRSQLLNNI